MEKYYKKATLDEVFNKMTSLFHNETAIIFEEKTVTYENLRKEVYSYAIKLRKMGVKQGDRVGLLLPNCYEYICLYFANFLLGSIVVPINSRVVKQELKNILCDSSPKILIFQDLISNINYCEMVKELRPQLPNVEKYIMRGEKSDPSFLPLDEVSQMEEDLERKIENFERPQIEETDVALLAYTSGTTSTPKGVMITHGGLVNTSYYGGALWGLGYDQLPKESVILSIAPLYGAQGFLAVLLDLVNGITMKWLSTFNPNEIIKAISKGNVTIFHTQPTMWSLLMSSNLLDFSNFSNLKTTIVSGSLCSYNLAKRIQEKTGTVLLDAYGLIEGTGISIITRPDDSEEIRLNTVGRAIPGVKVKIVDENRKEVPNGEVGEIAIRGNLMRGYYNNEKKTRQVIDEEGFLYTGDLGRFYKGTENIQIVGRSKEMIIRGGFNVYPIDIEEQLLNFEKVQDASVVGKEDPILSESIVAFIIPKPGCKLTKSEVIKYCSTVLSSNKIPDEVYFLKQFPTILNGKVKKNDLKKWAEEGIPEQELFTF